MSRTAVVTTQFTAEYVYMALAYFANTNLAWYPNVINYLLCAEHIVIIDGEIGYVDISLAKEREAAALNPLQRPGL